MRMSPGGPVRVVLFTNATTAANGSSQPIDITGATTLTFYVKASAALSAGTLIFEERDQVSDVPSLIDTVTLATPFVSAGGTYAYHVGGPGGSFCYGLISARIGTSVTGGTLTVVLRAC